MKRIAVIGGGTGGTLAANLLAGRLGKEIKREQISIDLFADGSKHSFQPAYLDIAFRGLKPNSTIKDESNLIRKEVRLDEKGVKSIDLDERKIFTMGDEVVKYDYLVIATGSIIYAEAIPGLKESSLNFHESAGKSAEIWQALQNFTSGKIVISVAGVPHKCPPSPNEAVFLLDDYLRRRGIREKSEIVYATPYPRPYPNAIISKIIEPLYDERGVEVASFFNVDSVDQTQNKIYSLEGDVLDFDMLIAVPPHRGADVVQASSIGDEDGWVATDRFKLNVVGYDDAYALGDATNLPISKTGVVAHLQAKVVVDNIIADLNGWNSQYLFNGRINCPFETGGGKATFVSATYESQPKLITPSRRNFWMKKAFSRIYWSSLSGRWEPVFDWYFGRTYTEIKKTGSAVPMNVPTIGVGA